MYLAAVPARVMLVHKSERVEFRLVHEWAALVPPIDLICAEFTEDQMRKFNRKTGVPLQRGERSIRSKLPAPSVENRAGRPVRSQLEKCCAEFLGERSIQFIYEPLLLLSGKQYRPDFYLPEYGLFIEICGFTHMPFYRDRVELKQKVYAAQGLRCLFIEARTGKSLKDQLAAGLREFASVASP